MGMRKVTTNETSIYNYPYNLSLNIFWIASLEYDFGRSRAVAHDQFLTSD